MRIVVDSRESRTTVPTLLRSLGHDTEVEKLPVGDYAVPGALLVERKDANDLCLSITDGRLFGQAALLAEQPDYAVVVVEGDLQTVYSQISRDAVEKALVALSAFYNIQVVRVPSPAETARYISTLAIQLAEGLGYEILLRVKQPRIDGALSQYLVEGLPGVGPETARRLLDRFGSPTAVFSASAEELREVRGVGPKVADRIVEALHHVPEGYVVTKRGKLSP